MECERHKPRALRHFPSDNDSRVLTLHSVGCGPREHHHVWNRYTSWRQDADSADPAPAPSRSSGYTAGATQPLLKKPARQLHTFVSQRLSKSIRNVACRYRRVERLSVHEEISDQLQGFRFQPVRFAIRVSSSVLLPGVGGEGYAEDINKR